jgi:hypothetical protein
VQPTQGANLISNIPHNLTEARKTISLIQGASAYFEHIKEWCDTGEFEGLEFR